MTRQGRQAGMEDIREVLRTYQRLSSIKGTARLLGCAKGTVRRYVRWARDHGLLGDVLPSEGELARAWGRAEGGEAIIRSQLTPHQGAIEAWLAGGIPLVRIQELLVEQHGWSGSYATLKRYTAPWRDDTEATIRIETKPGEEAQVDFGHLGPLWDEWEKRMRKAWVFLMTLSYSRHQYAEVVFGQDVGTWVGCHRRAFEWFGGVPERVVLDNLKAAIVKAAVYDPLVNRTYAEQAEHYGFLISPCRPGEPQHKGKVERGVPYLRNNFWRTFQGKGTTAANAALKVWIMDTAGQRVHGTIRRKPLEVFAAEERSALRPLPATPYDLAVWKEATVHADCHVVAEGSYYSAPYRLRGERVLVRLGLQLAQIYKDHELVASHARANRPGTRRTDVAHYPPEKAAWLEKTPQWCLAEAARVGPWTRRLVEEVLGRQHPLDGLRRAQGLLHLGKTYGWRRLERASLRAVNYGLYTYQGIKRMLERGLDGQPMAITDAPVASRSFRHARPVAELLAHLPAKEA